MLLHDDCNCPSDYHDPILLSILAGCSGRQTSFQGRAGGLHQHPYHWTQESKSNEECSLYSNNDIMCSFSRFYLALLKSVQTLRMSNHLKVAKLICLIGPFIIHSEWGLSPREIYTQCCSFFEFVARSKPSIFLIFTVQWFIPLHVCMFGVVL